MRVYRLAGDHQMHDLGGAFEDPVDAQIPKHLLGGHPSLTAGGQRLGGLKAASTAISTSSSAASQAISEL